MDKVEIDGEEFSVSMPRGDDPLDLPPWYEQFLKLNDKQKNLILRVTLNQIKKSKPEAYEFIKNMKCEIVGLQPHVSYCLPDSSDGDADITWVHGFAGPTILFWCKQGKFGFFINPNLDHNNTILNKIPGNKKQALKGFTS